ncbi:MAG: hypothetical protein M3325_08470 [Actinomycetota bacterium]|nr:hypothetical protein [Actinomycetota bacterium]
MQVWLLVRAAVDVGPSPAPTPQASAIGHRPERSPLRRLNRQDRGRHGIFVGLHLVEGRLHELEVFDTDEGEGRAVDLTAVTSLTRPEIE